MWPGYIQEYSYLKGSKSVNYTFKTSWVISNTGIAQLEAGYTFLMIVTKCTPPPRSFLGFYDTVAFTS